MTVLVQERTNVINLYISTSYRECNLLLVNMYIVDCCYNHDL